ncbi:ferroxidase fet3 [Coemansia sp. RSA 2049]|nr:ferroxidase fet3 [Coemansia sp. RSA 1939]KAJ2525156.1 ferroxidase fet3 [Coemansia sp. RSA 2049]KAJ2615093.1 ferroxidase fet3 [Coemansia sp. RSA 1804]KAJ2690105.1 ferroxidase fet3 [Coemansia sp. RSA 1285]
MKPLLFLALALTTALGAEIYVEWNVGYVSVNRDGYNMRRAIGVNGTLPIPAVEAVKGDTVYLTVNNKLDVSTSIHAHGLFQNGTAHMDGPAMIAQCGIPPGRSFTYEYTLTQTGTYWLHAHDHHQNSDGLRTAFVIYDSDSEGSPYAYDEAMLLTFEDWFREEFAERAAQTLDPNANFPPPHGHAFGLINGIDGNQSMALHFEPGRRYRIHLANMGVLNWFKFQLPGHRMQVIEVDGVYTQPMDVDIIDIAPAQRYSVLVSAHDSDSFNYQYNATLHANFIPTAAGLIPRVYLGNIIYKKGAPLKQLPPIDEASLSWLDDINLTPLDEESALPVTRSVEYTVGNALYSTGQRLDFFNNITFALPDVPTLYTALTAGDTALDPRVYGPQTNALVLRHNEVVELTIHNPNNLPHPFHMHGHAFQITEYGPADLPVDDDRAPTNITITTAAAAPVKRDTMVIPEYYYIKVRFRADNPGIWLLHCHLDIHFAMGMALAIVEAPDVLQKSLHVPPEMYSLCHQQKIPVSGNAAGKKGLDFTGFRPPPVVVERNSSQT